jgi:hypothetical protein
MGNQISYSNRTNQYQSQIPSIKNSLNVIKPDEIKKSQKTKSFRDSFGDSSTVTPQQTNKDYFYNSSMRDSNLQNSNGHKIFNPMTKSMTVSTQSPHSSLFSESLKIGENKYLNDYMAQSNQRADSKTNSSNNLKVISNPQFISSISTGISKINVSRSQNFIDSSMNRTGNSKTKTSYGNYPAYQPIAYGVYNQKPKDIMDSNLSNKGQSVKKFNISISPTNDEVNNNQNRPKTTSMSNIESKIKAQSKSKENSANYNQYTPSYTDKYSNNNPAFQPITSSGYKHSRTPSYVVSSNPKNYNLSSGSPAVKPKQFYMQSNLI